MRALTFHGKRGLRVEDAPDPRKKQDGCVTVVLKP